MSNTKKQAAVFSAIACLIFIAHPACATEQAHHTMGSRLKTTFIDLGKESVRFVVSNAQQPSGFMFISGLVLAAAGSCILLITIIQNLPKILGSSAMIATGAALVFFSNKQKIQPTSSYCPPKADLEAL